MHLDSCLKNAKRTVFVSMSASVETLTTVLGQLESDLEVASDEQVISKASVQRKFASVKPTVDLVVDKFFESLSDLFTAVKPIVDVHVVSYLGKKNPIRLMLSRFVSEVSSISGGLVSYSRYYLGDVEVHTSETSNGPSQSELSPSSLDALTQSLYVLLAATSFKRVSELFFTKLDVIMRESDFDFRSITTEEKENFVQIFRNLAETSAISFVELRSSIAISLLPALFLDARERTTTSRDDVFLSDRSFEICKILSDSALLTSLVFNEPLPAVKIVPTETRRVGRQSVANRY